MKKSILTFLLLAAMLSASACSSEGSSTAEKEPMTKQQITLPESTPKPEPTKETKPDKNGFDESTNRYTEIGNIGLSVPEYWGEGEKKNDNIISYVFPAADPYCAVLYMYTDKGDLTQSKFEENKEKLLKKILETIDIELSGEAEIKDCYIAGFDGAELRGSAVYNGEPALVIADAAFDGDGETLVMSFLLQMDSAEESYVSDYECFIDSARVIENTKADESTIRPEVKQLLDSYEAFVDEYIAFMVSFENNPSDLNLILRSADIISQYADFADKIDAIDEDELTTAELSYYLEVTARCTQKLLAVIG